MITSNQINFSMRHQGCTYLHHYRHPLPTNQADRIGRATSCTRPQDWISCIGPIFYNVVHKRNTVSRCDNWRSAQQVAYDHRCHCRSQWFPLCKRINKTIWSSINYKVGAIELQWPEIWNHWGRDDYSTMDKIINYCIILFLKGCLNLKYLLMTRIKKSQSSPGLNGNRSCNESWVIFKMAEWSFVVMWWPAEVTQEFLEKSTIFAAKTA